MATEQLPEKNTSDDLLNFLPFFNLDHAEFAQVRSGPRISALHTNPRAQHGPVTIRNFIAGSTKKALRLASPKAPKEYQDVLLRLPVELQLSVLEHLHPMDLYHFSQVSKAFRRMVLAPKATGVWKAAFDVYSEIPRPPLHVSLAEWTFMLYGPGICCECGKYGALTDFGLLRRYCEICMKECYAYINAFKDVYGNTVSTDHVIWDVLPRTFRYNGLRFSSAYPTTGNAKFLKKDFYPLMKRLTLLELLIANGVPHIAGVYDDYVGSHSARTARTTAAASKVTLWAMDVYRQCSSDQDSMNRRLNETCRKRLENRGHDGRDIGQAIYTISSIFRQESITKLSTKAYRRLRPRIEGLVQTRKVNRIKEDRQRLLESIYADYQKFLTPDQWQYLPPKRLVGEIDEFREFMTAKFDARGDIAPGDAALVFPKFIEEWTKKNLEEIVDLFPGNDDAEELFETKVRRLELATSVVTCSDCKYKVQGGRVLLGWKNICRHRRSIAPFYIDPCSTYEINDSAVAAAVSLVSCVGLDPSTATAAEMDERNDRFLCGNCMSDLSRGVRGLKAYTWTECIQHTMEMNIQSNVMHDTPAWLLLTPEAARFVREHEPAYPHPLHSIWRCNHCAEHFTSSVLQAHAIEHVKRVHCIVKPVIGTDVVHDRRFPVRRRRNFRLGLDPAFECRCMRCPELAIYKLWEKEDLAGHLLMKHDILDPIEGTDWHKVNIIAAAAASPAPPPTPSDNTTTQAQSTPTITVVIGQT